MEALTEEEFKALLRLFFEAGLKRGKYGSAPPSYFEKAGIILPPEFDEFYEATLKYKK